MKISPLTYAVGICGIFIITGCGMQIKPLPSFIARLEAQKKKSAVPQNVVYRFFDEQYYGNADEWHFPDNSKVYIAEEGSGKNGEVALKMDLVPNDYSGGALELDQVMYDVKPYYKTGAFEFWIRGKNGGEVASIALGDENDGVSTEVKVPLDKYGTISKQWTHFSIPLADFGMRGTYWDEDKQVEIPKRIDWSKISLFDLSIEKGDNKEAVFYLDDIYIVKDVYPPAPDVPEDYWDERNIVLPVPPASLRPAAVKSIRPLFHADALGGITLSADGGKSGFKLQPTADNPKKPSALAMYLDNTDYSDVNIPLGKTIDLSQLRNNGAGVAFWAKFGPGTEQISFGFQDDNSDNKEVQSNINMNDFGKIDTNWHYFMIPLKEFANEGTWYNEDTKADIPDTIQWNKIDQLVFSSDKFVNRVVDADPAIIYVKDVDIIDKVPGYVDPDIYWNKFTSNEPEKSLFDFDKPADCVWETEGDDASDISFLIVELADNSDPTQFGRKALEVHFSNNEWCYASFSFLKNSTLPELRDWRKYLGLRFEIYNDKESTVYKIQINDSGNEAFIANITCKEGWNDIILPFKNFKKDPSYQEPGAELNNKLDLDAVMQIGIDPALPGSGMFQLKDLKLTNVRKLEK
jgi:hypothetical protein